MQSIFYKWLNSARTCKHEREEQELKIQELYQRLLPSGISYEKDKVDTSPSDRLTEGFSDIFEEQEKSRALLWDRYYYHVQIIAACNRYITDDKEWFAVAQYYAKCQSPKSLARELGITERQFYRIKRNAVAKLYKKWGEICAEIIGDNSGI